jgi:peptidoglycan/LPS O-acetylase OafA/YrhL
MPNRYLVAAGAWSYSLYLMHAQGGGLFERLHLPSLGGVPDWILVMSSSLLFSYLFYVLIERPSHKLARKIRVRGARNVSDIKRVAVTAPPELNPSEKEIVGS